MLLLFSNQAKSKSHGQYIQIKSSQMAKLFSEISSHDQSDQIKTTLFNPWPNQAESTIPKQAMPRL